LRKKRRHNQPLRDTEYIYMKALGYLFVIVVISPLLMIWNGYVLSVLWRWFMVPTFHLPTLSIPVAIGIAMVISYLTHQYDPYESPDSASERMLKSAVVGLCKPGFALLFGWIVLQFV
jgi:multisubunit Na+/H+ antiporter MnhB subunit